MLTASYYFCLFSVANTLLSFKSIAGLGELLDPIEPPVLFILLVLNGLFAAG